MPDKYVLVVDGDELVRWALERELSAHRMSVRAVSSCAKALAHLGAEPCDLALVDVDPPEGNRLRLIEAIRSRCRDATIMAMGCDASSELRQRLFDRGCEQFIDKPFDLGEIVNLARSAVGQFPVRRRFRRYHCRLPLRLSIVSPSSKEVDLDLDNLGGTTVDLGQAGLRLRTAYPLRPAQRVRVRLTSDEAPCASLLPPTGALTVVWSAADPDGVVAGLRLGD